MKPPDISTIFSILALVMAVTWYKLSTPYVTDNDVTAATSPLLMACIPLSRDGYYNPMVKTLLQHTATSLQYPQVCKSTVCPVYVNVSYRQQQVPDMCKSSVAPVNVFPSTAAAAAADFHCVCTHRDTTAADGKGAHIGAKHRHLHSGCTEIQSTHAYLQLYAMPHNAYHHLCYCRVYESLLCTMYVMVSWQMQQQVTATGDMVVHAEKLHICNPQSSGIVQMLVSSFFNCVQLLWTCLSYTTWKSLTSLLRLYQNYMKYLLQILLCLYHTPKFQCIIDGKHYLKIFLFTNACFVNLRDI